MRRILTGAATAAAAALLLTACTGTPASTPAATNAEAAPGFLAVADDSVGSGGTVTIDIDYDSEEANGLDPATADLARSWTIFSLVYETLLTVDENLQPQPALASSWEQPSDTEYVFTLRDDAVFSNGRPVTAADVAGSLQRMLDAGGSWASQLGPVSSIAATGDHEVTVELSAPYTPFLSALAHPSTAILPMAELEAGTFDPTTQMLGSGLLVLDEHRQDEYWKFGINAENPAAGDLGFSAVEIDVVPEEATRLAALRDGSTDLSLLLSTDSETVLADTPEVAVVNQANSDFYYLMLNSNDPSRPTADPAVRFAINAALNRQQIVDVALAGQGQPTAVTPSILPGSCAPEDVPSEGLSDDDIRDALDGVTVGLLLPSDSSHALIGQIIQQQLAEYGATVNLEQTDGGTFSSRIYTDKPSDFDLAMTWFAGYVDPSTVTGWWNVAAAGFPAGYMSDDPAVDALIDEARTLPAGADREAKLAELCAAVDQNSEMVPLITRTTFLGYRTNQLSPTIQASEGYGNFLRYLVDYQAAK
jgi:peptide/nickel transport system substrate-binding protein